MSPQQRRRDIGRRIELARSNADLNQEELAEKMTAETGLSMSKATISRLEAGTGRDLYEVEMDALVAILDQPRDWFKGVPGTEFRVNPRYLNPVMGRTTHPPILAAA